MPLIIMCGFPFSGKSYIAKNIKKYIEEHENKKVIIISDDNCGLTSDKPLRYKESLFEKELRGKLKSQVQSGVNENEVIILDSLNYIKGFRYELFCIAKSRSTPHCVIHCTTEEDVCKQRNNDCSDPKNHYPDEIFSGLVMRFEAPIGTNRWDSPLFEINSVNLEDPSLELSAQICTSLFRHGTPVPNKATQSVATSSSNYLQDLEQRTQSIVKHIVDLQKTLSPGTAITVPGSVNEKFVLKRHQTPAQLQKGRRQFIASLCRIQSNNSSVSHKDDNSVKNIADSFVVYLNNCT